MRTGTIAFLMGILALLQMETLPDVRLTCLLPVCILLVLRISRMRHAAFFVCGFLWALFRADLHMSHSLEQEMEGQSLRVEGIITSLPEQRGDHVRFQFNIRRCYDASGQQRAAPGLVRLSWYGRQSVAVRPGAYWQFRVRLKRPYGFRNPGGFDYEGWLFRHGIHATGYVQSAVELRRTDVLTGHFLDQFRFRIAGMIEKSLAGEHVALVKALVLGERSDINTSQWQVLKGSGTSHLLAISGLHIGLIAGLGWFLGRWLWSTSTIAVNMIPASRFAAVPGMVAATFYAAMAGFSVPTKRALIMMLLVVIALSCSRRMSVSWVMLAAMAVLLVIDPFAPMAADFWLSFCAVLVIAYGMTCRPGPGNLWWRWGRVQLLVAIGLSPLLVMWFQQVPILSGFANILAVPWVGFIVVPCVLIGSILLFPAPGIGSWILQLGADALDLLWPFLEWIAGMDFSIGYFPVPAYLSVLVAMVGISILLMPRGLPGRWIGCVWCLPLLVSPANELNDGEFRFTLLDVGQGLASVVETRRHVLVFDTGPWFSERFDAGSAVVVPYLRHIGSQHIDTLIISHGDNDHIGGARAILEEYPVARLLTSAPELFNHAGNETCRAGQAWQWDGVLFRVLHPDADDGYSANNRSCVLLVRSGRRSVLLNGDIEALAEERLIEKYADVLHATAIVASHHGSMTSSAPGYIHTIAPRYAFFPVGYRNRFGFPKEDIIRRFQAAGAQVMTTAKEGAIRFETNGEGYSVRSYRRENQRFWHTRDEDG